jgi:CheY-like chemotaxis protein
LLGWRGRSWFNRSEKKWKHAGYLWVSSSSDSADWLATKLGVDSIVQKILLVEDNEMNRDMLSRRLERRGFQIVMAVDGAQGVSMAQTENPDLILMDMSLPVMDGWTATRTLKDAEATRGIPVIGLTAHAMAGDREKCMEAGCDDYDTKPIELARLMEKITAQLEKKKTP